MKNFLIRLLSIIFQSIDALLCKLHIKHPIVVVYIDGGICSQMLQYLHGQYYVEYGIDVYYDDTWFKTNGKDQFGNMSRDFELTDICPNLKYKRITKLKRKWYLIFFKAMKTNDDRLPNPNKIQHSIYLNGYWDLPADICNDLFVKCFNLQDSKETKLLKNLENQTIVGLHVRRGDLAQGDNPYYGGVTDNYFVRAIELCNNKFNPQKYLFFSDEPDWVEQNICLRINSQYEIVRGNKAWEDLWLLAQCPVIVASQGSFGKVAAKLNPNAALIQCDNDFAIRGRANTWLIK